MKVTVGVFFGGRSTENEVSVITGLQALNAIDKNKYDTVPFFITKDGDIYTGELIGKIEEYSDVPLLLKKSHRVMFLNEGGRVCVYNVSKKIDTRKPISVIDIALPCVHGTNVEDGVLSGFFEMLKLPYAGCDVLSSSVGMDKVVTKAALKLVGIPVLDCVDFSYFEYVNDRERVENKLLGMGFPLIVKPINLGSSIGIRIAENHSELSDAIEYAFTFTDRVMIEPAVMDLVEVNCSVLGDRDKARASVCEKPISSGGILDFDDKYTSGSKYGKSSKFGGVKGVGDGAKSSGMASLKREIPANISDDIRDEIQRLSVEAFKALGCLGVVRFDFIIDEGDGDKIWLNEVNTIPGSLSFYLWEATGLSYPKLIDELISLGLKRDREKSNLTYSFESNILSGFKGGFGGKTGSKNGSKAF